MAKFETPAAFYKNLPRLKHELLKGGEDVRLVKDEKAVWRLRHEASLNMMRAVIDAHNVIRETGAEHILKDGKKRCVTLVDREGKHYVVKEFFSPGPWGRFASDSRGWVFNWLLEYAGLPVPRALAWCHRRSGPGYIVFEWLPGHSGYHVLRECGDEPERFNILADKISDLLNHLYTWRITHEDLKLSNLLIDEERLYLVDNDAIILDSRITAAVWQRNLRHLTGDASNPAMKQLREFLEGRPPSSLR